ncbi:MAG: glutathione S-transferase family protein [Pseudomonadota bacterium]|jgi:glutathione S-transferase|nr:MAG: glutathione S-transferase [Pseudomonadota bacterium]
MHLTIGNKLYSSWSLRPWMVLRAFDIPFEETVIPLYRPESKARILQVSPSGKVPCLTDGDVTVWESLAIIEYLAEKFPEKAIWPKNQKARAHARAAASEMHAGLQALRNACPMNLGKRFAKKDRGAAVAADVARVTSLWREARQSFGSGGPFLYGEFSAADAMFAPVVTRLDTYQVDVEPDTRAYMDAILSHPAFVAWREAALQEPWSLPHYEEGETPVEVFHRPQN